MCLLVFKTSVGLKKKSRVGSIPTCPRQKTVVEHIRISNKKDNGFLFLEVDCLFFFWNLYIIFNINFISNF